MTTGTRNGRSQIRRSARNSGLDGAKTLEGISETGRRAKFYSLTRIGRKQIERETENWERIAATMSRFLAPSS
jgi:hypothetical protein